MKINGIEDVNEIVLSHKGKNMSFGRFTEPSPYGTRVGLQTPNRAYIAFDDTAEILQLVEALERFRNELMAHIGYWEKKSEGK